MFSSRKSIRIDKELYQRLEQKAGESGYSSTEEFVNHLLESAVSGGKDDGDPDREQIDRQLRGLGYLE